MRIYLAAAYAINTIVSVINFCIIADAFASWFPSLYANPTFAKIFEIIHFIVSPFINAARKLLSKISFFDGMPIDISPIVALFLVRVLNWILMQILGFLRIFLV